MDLLVAFVLKDRLVIGDPMNHSQNTRDIILKGLCCQVIPLSSIFCDTQPFF